ncbi:MAG: hypothetical protein KDK23_10560 [Leptospiraceae bacterium]|nr:hypothetical protein [Leptospiraceae bacterium]
MPFFFRSLLRRRLELSVAVDHPVARKAALKGLHRLHGRIKRMSVLRRIRIRKRLRLRPHGVRLELHAMAPWPRLLGLPGLTWLSPRMEDFFYYWQRRYRLDCLAAQTGSAAVGDPVDFRFPSFLEGDSIHFSALFMQPHPHWEFEEGFTIQSPAFQGPDAIPFHLGRSHRFLGRLKKGPLLHQTWTEALLFAGEHRWQGLLVQDSPTRCLEMEYTGRHFRARFQDRRRGSDPLLTVPAQYQWNPVMETGFPHLPLKDGMHLFFLDGSLRIHIYRMNLLDPVNHRLFLRGRALPTDPNGWQRILNISAEHRDVPQSGRWVYSSSALLELEKLDTVDVLDCEYRNLDRQIRLKTTQATEPIVYGRN